MKKTKTHLINLLILVVFSVSSSQAQVPQGFNYQGIARDIEGKPKSNLQLEVEIGILNDLVGDSILYTEMHQRQTNLFGLFSLTIGQGTPLEGDFFNIDWGSGNKFLKIVNDGPLQATTQLSSVPYAMHANSGSKSGKNKEDVYYEKGRVIIGSDSTLHPYPGNLLQLYSPQQESRIILYGANGGSNYNNISLWDLQERGWQLEHKSASAINHNLAISYYNGATYTNAFAITPTGKVGIGLGYSENPQFPLHIKHLTDPVLKLERGSDGRSLLLDMNSIRTNDDHDLALGVNGLAEDIYIDYPTHNVGIGTLSPMRKLHVNGAMRFEPQQSSPASPQKGDSYFDDNTNKLRVFDGTSWKDCW